MGRPARPIDVDCPQPGKLALELRNLRVASGNPSYRELALRAHFSRTALARAVDGRSLPSLPLVLAFVTACGGDPDEWRTRWHTARDEMTIAPQAYSTYSVEPPWPAEPVVDGADPEAAGCGQDAITVHARRLALKARRHIIGQVELRYSPRKHAAWARFMGYESFKYIAQRQQVEVIVEVFRHDDGAHTCFQEQYMFDYHYSDLLCTNGTGHHAEARIVIDGNEASAGKTDQLLLT